MQAPSKVVTVCAPWVPSAALPLPTQHLDALPSQRVRAARRAGVHEAATKVGIKPRCVCVKLKPRCACASYVWPHHVAAPPYCSANTSRCTCVYHRTANHGGTAGRAYMHAILFPTSFTPAHGPTHTYEHDVRPPLFPSWIAIVRDTSWSGVGWLGCSYYPCCVNFTTQRFPVPCTIACSMAAPPFCPEHTGQPGKMHGLHSRC